MELDIGDWVEVFGLESEAGRELNGRKGIISKFIEDKDRFEVNLAGEKTVSVRPKNLKRSGARSSTNTAGDSGCRGVAKPAGEDARWRRGDQARLVGLLHHKDSALHPLNSTLGYLVSRTDGDQWTVEVQGKQHKIPLQNLRVCSSEHNDPRGLLSLALPKRLLLGFGLLTTLYMLLEAELLSHHISVLAASGQSNAVPGWRIAILSSMAPLCSLAWIVGTVAGCYFLHGILHDPEVTFPQISELGVGPASGKALYRIGFAAAATLLAAMVLIHRELALPHLPGGRTSEAGENFTWYALAAAAGVGLQGIFLLEPGLSKQTVAHLVGAMFFFYAAWCHMSPAGRLYRPEDNLPSEDDPGYDEAVAFVEAASTSQLLQHPFVKRLVWFRHKVLMSAPMALFVIPILSQFTERAPVQTPGATSPKSRSLMGLAQWLVVGNFALIFMSYGPELSVAALMPLPVSEANL